MIPWCFQQNYCYIHFQYVTAYWKIIFQKSIIPQTHLLMKLQQHRNYGWLDMKYQQNTMFGVTGDDSLVFQTKLLLYSL